LPSFKVYTLLLGRRHYLLLPKLNSLQFEELARRFEEIGSVERGLTLAVNTRRGTIKASEAGLCWSSFDQSDAVLPVVPDLLSCPKEEATVEIIRSKYLRMERLGGWVSVRMLPRLEGSSFWRKMRASGGCALAPDEYAVVSSLFSRTSGAWEMVTDFFVDGCTPLLFGRKRYFDSRLDSYEAASTLCVVGKRGPRNSYLPNDGEIGPIPTSALARSDWVDLLSDLGEWCPFIPI
jgi:hypothetical protein